MKGRFLDFFGLWPEGRKEIIDSAVARAGLSIISFCARRAELSHIL